MTRIRTRSGLWVDLQDPQPDQIEIADIAHGLSMTCRWNGQCSMFYSVAQHSVLCSMYTSAEFALPALMHDASEAYLGDVASPLKMMLGYSYRGLEESMMEVIADKFNFQFPLGPEVKEVDHNFLVTEWAGIMNGDPKFFGFDKAPYTTQFMSWGPATAYRMFIERFHFLTKQVPLSVPSIEKPMNSTDALWNERFFLMSDEEKKWTNPRMEEL